LQSKLQDKKNFYLTAESADSIYSLAHTTVTQWFIFYATRVQQEMPPGLNLIVWLNSMSDQRVLMQQA